MQIEFLYPYLGNLYGEEMQMRFIERCFPAAQIHRTQLNDKPAFASGQVDLLFLGPLTEHSQERVVQALRPYREQLVAAITAGTPFLATGNALEVLGEYIEHDDGSRFECLGLFSTHARQRLMARYNSLYLGSYGSERIVGFKAQFSHSYGEIDFGSGVTRVAGPKPHGLFQTIRGAGLNPEAPYEGIHWHNFIGTYLLGPLLILNPHFTAAWLREVTGQEVQLPFAAELTAAYEQRLADFTRPNVQF